MAGTIPSAQATRGAASMIAATRLAALKDLPEKIGIALSRDVSGDEATIQRLIAEEAELLAAAVTNHTQIYGKTKLKTSGAMLASAEAAAHHERVFAGLKVFYEHVSQVYYATGSVDIDHIKKFVVKEIRDLQKDISSSTLLTPEHKRPFLSMLTKASTRAEQKLQILNRVGAFANRVVGSDLFQAGIAAAATRSPIVGLAVMMMKNRPAQKTQFDIDASRAEQQFQRSGYLSAQPSRGGGPTPTPTVVPQPPTSTPTAETLNPTPPSPIGGGQPTRRRGFGSPINGSASITDGVLTVLTTHTKLLQGIHLNTENTVKELRRLIEANTLAAEEDAFETQGNTARRKGGLGGTADGTTPPAGAGPGGWLKSIIPNIVDGFQTLMVTKFGLNMFKGKLGASITQMGKGVWSRVMQHIPTFPRLSGAAQQATNAARNSASTVADAASRAAARTATHIRSATASGLNFGANTSRTLGSSLMGAGRGALQFGSKAAGAAGRIAPWAFAGYDAYQRKQAGQTNLQAGAGVSGGLLGAMAGSAGAGALMGSVFPGAGTLAGGIVGAAAGIGGYYLGSKAADTMTGANAGPASATAPTRVPVGTRLSTLTADERQLLDTIASHEQGKAGYDSTFANGMYRPGTGDSHGSDAKSKPITSMTLRELYDVQKMMLRNPLNTARSSAAGRYQVVSHTLFGKGGTPDNPSKPHSLMHQMQLSPDTVFSAELQDRMAMHLVNQHKRAAKLNNPANPVESFRNRMSKEWASVQNSAGRGTYSGQSAPTILDQGLLARNLGLSAPTHTGDTASAGRNALTPSLSTTRGTNTSINAPSVVVNNINGTNVSNGSNNVGALPSPTDTSPYVRQLITGR